MEPFLSEVLILWRRKQRNSWQSPNAFKTCLLIEKGGGKNPSYGGQC
jgi:hypothetical protein